MYWRYIFCRIKYSIVFLESYLFQNQMSIHLVSWSCSFLSMSALLEEEKEKKNSIFTLRVIWGDFLSLASKRWRRENSARSRISWKLLSVLGLVNTHKLPENCLLHWEYSRVKDGVILIKHLMCSRHCSTLSSLLNTPGLKTQRIS